MGKSWRAAVATVTGTACPAFPLVGSGRGLAVEHPPAEINNRVRAARLKTRFARPQRVTKQDIRLHLRTIFLATIKGLGAVPTPSTKQSRATHPKPLDVLAPLPVSGLRDQKIIQPPACLRPLFLFPAGSETVEKKSCPEGSTGGEWVYTPNHREAK